MIKYFIGLFFLLLSFQASALHVFSPGAKIDITTDKVSYLIGAIDPAIAYSYLSGVLGTSNLSGDRIVIIDSLGGYVDSGQLIIDSMEAEKASGTRVVCVVRGEATSMAFNILTHCNVRLATKDSKFLVHKIAIGGLSNDRRWTTKNLRWLANQLEREDEQYRRANASAMHLSLQDYDEAADEERTWFTSRLLDMGYLHGIIKFK